MALGPGADDDVGLAGSQRLEELAGSSSGGSCRSAAITATYSPRPRAEPGADGGEAAEVAGVRDELARDGGVRAGSLRSSCAGVVGRAVDDEDGLEPAAELARPSARAARSRLGQGGGVAVDRHDDGVADPASGRRDRAIAHRDSSSRADAVDLGVGRARGSTGSVRMRPRRPLGDREAARRRRVRRVDRLAVVGHRVVDVGADAGRGRARSRTASRSSTSGHGEVADDDGRRPTPRSRPVAEGCRVARGGSRAAGRCPHRSSGSRRRRTAACISSRRLLRPPARPTRYLPSQPYWRSDRTACGELGVAGDDGAAVAEGAEVLGRVEAERRRVADRAGTPAVAPGADRLGAVLDHADAARVAHGDDRGRCRPSRRRGG